MEIAAQRVVLSTIDDAGRARELARMLVERRLVACVNVVGPLRSIYRWQGAVEEAEEHLLVIKTVAARVDALRRALVEAHPYDVPELIVLPVEGGHRPYLDWIADSVAD